MGERAIQNGTNETGVIRLPGVELRLTAEHALRAAIDNQVFAALRGLEPLDGGRAVQAVYVALIRRLPNVIPDRKRIAIDSGFSESSVKRAIRLLEHSKLIVVERSRGLSSTYHLADLRSPEVASRCVAEIRRMSRSNSPRLAGRVTSEPSTNESRSTSEPGTWVRSGPAVGSHVTPKEAMKIQTKQQGAAAQRSLEKTLRTWGLDSAAYLTKRGHRQAIRELTENPELAARAIDATMRKATWSPSAGVGCKVAFLRENLPAVFEGLSVQRPPGLRRAPPHDVQRERARDERHAQAQAVIDAMSEEEFETACKRLFAERPGLQRLYGTPSRESRGLRALLASAVMESPLSVSSAESPEPCSPMKAAFESTQ